MDALVSYERVGKYDKLHADNVRNKHITNTLSTNKKLDLYNCAVKGDLSSLKNLLEKEKFNLLEECSANGYYWTVLHYAAHYGFCNIVEYYLEIFKDHSECLDIVNIQSNLGLSPLFIALNNSLDIEKKKEILDVYIKYNCIDFKICNTENLDIFDICKKHGLLDYFLSILKED